MKAYIFRRLETTEEVSDYGDKHNIINWERILVTKTDAISIKVVPKGHTWSGKEIIFRRPIWRSESGELFIQDMQELGTNYFLNAAGDTVMGTPSRVPCRINGKLLANYAYEEYYYTGE